MIAERGGLVPIPANQNPTVASCASCCARPLRERHTDKVLYEWFANLALSMMKPPLLSV